jgi:sodium pump decarboxylase gamma subunit
MPEVMMQGAMLMLLGMGSVFSFLVVLVLTMKMMSVLASLIDFSESVCEDSVTKTPHFPDADAVLPVISAAIATYRKSHQ